MSLRNLLGILVIGFGAALLLDRMDLVVFDRLSELWWPVVFILIGIVSWRSNPNIRLWPGLIIVFGVFLLLSNLDLISGNGWDYFWPLIIVGIGLSLVLRQSLVGKTQESNESGGETFAAFSGVEKTITSENYQGGRVTAIFGGTKLDLRSARIHDGATLEVFAAFGGIELFVPKNVKIVFSLTPLFGGGNDKTQPDGAASLTLHVRGTALFGGVEVKN